MTGNGVSQSEVRWSLAPLAAKANSYVSLIDRPKHVDRSLGGFNKREGGDDLECRLGL